MKEYKIYSRDIWDYIDQLPYMPSREDRERLFNDEKTRERVKLWDYFFRIKPEDAGKPQREEISYLIKDIRETTKKCKQWEEEIQEKVKTLRKKALIKAIKRFIFGCFIFVSIILFISLFVPIHNIYIIVFFLYWLLLLLMLIGLGYFFGKEKKQSKELLLSLKEYIEMHSKNIRESRNQINSRRKEIARLKRQIPKPLSGEEVRKWLNNEFQKLWDYTKTEVALVRDIISIQGDNPNIEIKNPLTVLGPGELQEKIPKQFSPTINSDLNKHLSSKQAYQVEPKKYKLLYDVLYGVYFFEYIVVATDLLVAHSFFYDFIEDKVISEYTTEQYYTDIVALAIEEEFRVIKTLDYLGRQRSINIEDSPSFTLSLKSGEKHKVAFVNQEYFIKVKDKLKIDPNDIDKIYWINQAKVIANNVIKALRAYLRKHKTL